LKNQSRVNADTNIEPHELNPADSKHTALESRSNSVKEKSIETFGQSQTLNKNDNHTKYFALVLSTILIIAGWSAVILSYSYFPEFANGQNTWFQRSGAILIAAALYGEIFFNGVNLRLQLKGVNLLAELRYRIIHYILFPVSMILGSLIWGYGDLFHGILFR
jgi:hypothetical protein